MLNDCRISDKIQRLVQGEKARLPSLWLPAGEGARICVSQLKLPTERNPVGTSTQREAARHVKPEKRREAQGDKVHRRQRARGTRVATTVAQKRPTRRADSPRTQSASRRTLQTPCRGLHAASDAQCVAPCVQVCVCVCARARVCVCICESACQCLRVSCAAFSPLRCCPCHYKKRKIKGGSQQRQPERVVEADEHQHESQLH